MEHQISLLEHRLSTMEEQLEVLSSNIRDLDRKTTQIVDALIGNELSNNKGLSEKIADLEKVVSEHEDVLKRVRYFWWGATAIGGVLAAIIQFLFSLVR